MEEKEQIITDILVNSTKGVQGINNLTNAASKLDSQLQAILTHLNAIEKKSATATQNITKTYNQTFNSNDTNFKINKQGTPIAASKHGVISGGSSKAQLVALENELIKREQEEVKLAKQNVALRKAEAQARRTKNSYITKDYENKGINARANQTGAQARLLNARTAATESASLSNYRAFKNAHPEMFASAGGLRYDVKYQVGKGLSNAGQSVAGSSVLGVGKVIGNLMDVMGAFMKSPAAGVSAVFAKLGKAISDFTNEALKAYSELESIKTQLGIVYSSSTQAETAFSEISQYAVKSPFGVQQTSELAVLLKQSGVYATDLMNTLRMIGDTAGGNMEKMKRIANNYAQIVSIGKASMLDMRQFAYAGIPIFEAVSKELKVSQQELRKMISDGKVTSDIIEKVFKDLTGINGIFENATAIGAKTLKARLQNLEDAKQLAMGSFGEYGVKFGEAYGNDSYVNNIVTTIENIYQWLRESVDTVNIEKSVGVIENRNGRIEELKALIEYASQQGNETEKEQLEKELQAIIELKDIEKERAILNNSYNNKNNNYNEWKKQFESSPIQNEMDKLWAELGYEKQNEYSMQDYQTVADLYGFDALSKIIKELIKAEEGLKNVTAEETQAHKESNVINAQQLAFDQAAKAANKEGSYASGFEKLYSLYTSSDEYKKKKEEEESKWLQDSQKVLKEVLSYKNDNDMIDITKMTYSKLVEYLDDEKRVLDEGRKLTITRNKSDEVQTEDRKILSAQYKDIYAKIENSLAGKGSYAARNELGRLNRQINYNADNETFFKQFSRVLDDELSIFDELIKNATTDKDKNDYKNMRKALLASTFGYSAPSAEGLNAPTTTGKGGQEFVPLWKRIIAQNTGLTTQGMTNSAQAMNNYANDMAIRNMASGVLSATFKSMGMNTAMSLMRASGEVKTLKGDTGGTAQVDWKETKIAMHSFAMQLTASTDVITAYKKGLEDELETYQKLVAQGFTQAESQDLKSQKYVSTKTMEKLTKDAGEQLVNAFSASQFKTKSGAAAYLHDDGLFYDAIEGGNRIAEDQLIVEENLWKFIQQRLPELQAEIAEAEQRRITNKTFEEALNNVKVSSIMNRAVDLSTPLRQKASSLIENNSTDFANSVMKSLEVAKQSNPLYKDTSSENILSTALMLDSENVKRMREEGLDVSSYEEANRLLMEAIEKNTAVYKNLAYSSAFQNVTNLGYKKETTDELRKTLEKMTVGDPMKALKPENYTGVRGGTNWFMHALGVDTRSYDNRDLIVEAARKGVSWEAKDKFGNDRSVDLSQKDYTKMTDEEIFNSISEAEKKSILWKASLEQVEKTVKDLGASIANLGMDFAKSGLNKSFEALGAAIIKGEDAVEDLKSDLGMLAAEMLKNVGIAMQEAGWKLVSLGATQGNWALIGAGLGLAATGGVAAGLGGALMEKDSNESKTDKETQKLQSLKDDLTKLLEQARTDALYYENNLRHNKALGTNKEFSYKSVHDAVITPKGDVVTTDPKDYLIATKTPNQLVGGNGVTVQPVINCNVVNNTSARVTQEQNVNSDGSINIVTMIEEVAGSYISSSRSDDAFNARDYRMNGRQSVM